VYDASDRGTGYVTSSGVSTTDYDALDRPIRTTDELGNVSETVYDKRGLTIETRQNDTLLTRIVYDAAGRSVYQTDTFVDGTLPADITGTHTLYDDAGRVIATERVKGLHIDIIGTINDKQVGLVSAGTVISSTLTVYDNAGRVTQTTDEFGRLTQTLYDRFGQTIETRTQSTDETGADVWLVTRTVYDGYGRVELSTDRFLLPGTTLLGEGAAPARATRTLYDGQGRAHKTQRVAGAVVEIQNGAPVVTTNGSVLTTSETIYNAKGQVARTIAADGQIKDFVYDPQGRQVATIGHPLPAEEVGLGGAYPNQFVRHRTLTEFNDYGQRSREWSNLYQVEDASGNVVHVDDPAISVPPNARKTEFQYDEHGRAVKTTFADGSYVLVRYDSFGRQTAEMQQTAAAIAAEWSETENSFIVSASNPVQKIPTKLFEYDGQGRLSAVELPAVPDPQNNNVPTRPRYEYGYNEQGNQTLIRDPRVSPRG
jgi:YD repeat-containing protein